MPETQRWEERAGLDVTVEWNGAQFMARCRDDDLTATGKTLHEAREALLSMIQQYLALTDIQTWNEYFTSLQEAMEEDINNTWAHRGDRAIN